MLRLYVWYALSGFLALGYQVVWFRTFVDVFGSTNLTFAFVLVNFIGGLGAGSLASQWLTARVRARLCAADDLRLYGWIEIAVAVTAATLLVLPQLSAAWLGPFAYHRDGAGVFQPAALVGATQLAASVLCVFVPCFLMGVTFPLLCSAFVTHARLPAALYAWNTAGAATGVLACEFALLPTLGHGNLHVLLVLSNLAFGVWFAAGRVRLPSQPALEKALAPMPSPQYPASLLLAIAVVSGFLTGAFEADVLRRAQFLDCRSGAALSCISFWAIVAIFAGSACVRAAPWLRLRHVQAAAVIAWLAYLLVWAFAYPLREWMNHADNLRVRAALPPLPPGLVGNFQFFDFAYSAGAVLLFTGVLVFVPFFLLSLALPHACNAAQASGRHLGRLYGANTLAFCAGLLAFTTVVPRVNVFFALRFFLVVFAVGALALCFLRPREHRAGMKLAAAAMLALGAAVLTPASFAPTWMPKGSAAATQPVRAMRSNGAHTTYVVADPAGDLLFFDSHPMSGCNAMAQQYMRLMAHMPLLAHQQPQRALLICFGVGATASAIAAHGAIERIDVVDLNDQVFATAPEFAATNRNVIADPRVRLIHDDGRRFLAATDQTYDLITSEPPPPMFAGVARLYSREYYAQAKARLRPGGLMTQWLPTDQMPRAVMHAAIRSFVEVFADSMLFVGAHTNFILMGCNGPLRLGTLETRLAAEPRVAAELRPFGIRRPLDLILRIVQSGPQLARTTATAPIISDQHNLMSLTFHDPAAPPVVTFDPAAMFADLDAAGTATLACRPEWERIAMHLPRLKSRVPDFPESTLRSVRGLGGRKVEGAEVDWPVVAARMATAEQALAAGQGEAAVAQLEQVVALAPGYTAATRWLGEVLVRLGRPAPALHAFEAVRAADPDDPFGPWGKALVLLQTGQREQALAVLVPALARFADEPMLHRLDGDVLAALSRRGEAVLAYDRALALQPEDQATQQARQRCLTPAAR